MPTKLDLRQAISNANSARPAIVVRKPEGTEPTVGAMRSRGNTGEMEARSPHYRPGREGASNVTGYYPPAVKKQLRILAAEHETDIQDLLAEALNDLFAKYGRPEIAPRKVRK